VGDLCADNLGYLRDTFRVADRRPSEFHYESHLLCPRRRPSIALPRTKGPWLNEVAAHPQWDERRTRGSTQFTNRKRALGISWFVVTVNGRDFLLRVKARFFVIPVGGFPRTARRANSQTPIRSLWDALARTRPAAPIFRVTRGFGILNYGVVQVGGIGLEPMASAMSKLRSSQLS
jgi:hypothetical protein